MQELIGGLPEVGGVAFTGEGVKPVNAGQGGIRPAQLKDQRQAARLVKAPGLAQEGGT
jgi:hypothetical protein